MEKEILKGDGLMASSNGGGVLSSGNFGEVRVEGVTKVYEKEDKCRAVLQDCSLNIKRGKLTVLMGALFPWMTVYSNVTFGCQVQGVHKKEIKDRAELILRKVGLYEFKDKYSSQLSGGMQRRAELARAMINDPKIMILDEPFRGLDAMTRQLMQEFYVGLYEEVGRTNFFITHEIDEAIFLADRLVIMTFQPGKVKAEIEVDLPRPRDFRMMASTRFMEIRKQAIELLYEEAAKVFASGSKTACDLVGAIVARTCKRR
ncbi:MAG: ATP-binding cassette domain-containing protein [Nitrospirae bacterium]|nr:ATP-binding cassette domain-containing protein [Nitrospirota bacterium]MCL5061720.1 ATP-binding cassette domain-containing protein [Nitrospirota bacterium]MDA8340252.1 ATP-binding cassette domain-containing protein [Nitrospiraceae bacterium]